MSTHVFCFVVEIKCYQMLPVETHLKMCFRNKMTYLKIKLTRLLCIVETDRCDSIDVGGAGRS